MRLFKLNTGIVTQFNKGGGRVSVNYPHDKYTEYKETFKPLEK
jgi:hypothetical protein